MTIPDRRLPARVRAWGWAGALLVLLVLTSLAVASVSVWLVFPYLALMAVILITPPGRGERERDRGDGEGVESKARSAHGVEDAEGRPEAVDDDATVADASADPSTVIGSNGVSALSPAPDSEPRAVKTRRGKGRMRKAKAVAETPGATATWIQVGPGKFVRAEVPGPPAVVASPASEGEPDGSLPPSSGTVEGPAESPHPRDHDAEAPMVAEASSPPVGGSEERAVPAPDDVSKVETGPWHVEDNLERVEAPAFAAEITPEAADAAFASHQYQDGPPSVTDPLESEGTPSGVVEEDKGDSSPGERAEAEAVTTADASSATGETAEAWDQAAPHEWVVSGSATTWDGGNPEPAWGSADAIESLGAALLESYPEPDAPPLVDVHYGTVAGESESEGEIADGWAREARDQALEEIAGATVAGEDSAAALGMDATLENGPDWDGAGDNGIAPDAFGHVQPAGAAPQGDSLSEYGPVGDEARDNGIAPDAFRLVQPAEAAPQGDAPSEYSDDGDGAGDNGIAPDASDQSQPTETETEAASTQDRVEASEAPDVPSDRPNRPTVGTLLASYLRGQRPRVGPANATRSGMGKASPGRGARSGRRVRVTPGLRNLSRRRPVRSHLPCRTFPPRSPPALAGRS